jgi:hypothetical protein
VVKKHPLVSNGQASIQRLRHRDNRWTNFAPETIGFETIIHNAYTTTMSGVRGMYSTKCTGGYTLQSRTQAVHKRSVWCTVRVLYQQLNLDIHQTFFVGNTRVSAIHCVHCAYTRSCTTRVPIQRAVRGGRLSIRSLQTHPTHKTNT